MTGEYDVHGGAHDLEADMDDMDATGGIIRGTGTEVLDVAASSHRFLLDGNLLSSALLSPGTFATFEAELVAALDGPQALSAHGVKMTAAGFFMQAQANAYLAVDQALEIADDVGDWARATRSRCSSRGSSRPPACRAPSSTSPSSPTTACSPTRNGGWSSIPTSSRSWSRALPASSPCWAPWRRRGPSRSSGSR